MCRKLYHEPCRLIFILVHIKIPTIIYIYIDHTRTYKAEYFHENSTILCCKLDIPQSAGFWKLAPHIRLIVQGFLTNYWHLLIRTTTLTKLTYLLVSKPSILLNRWFVKLMLVKIIFWVLNLSECLLISYVISYVTEWFKAPDFGF